MLNAQMDKDAGRADDGVKLVALRDVELLVALESLEDAPELGAAVAGRGIPA